MFGLTKFYVRTLPISKATPAYFPFFGRNIQAFLRIRRNVHFFKDKFPPKSINLLPKPQYGGEQLVTLLTGQSTLSKQGASYINNLFEIARVPVFFEHIQIGKSYEEASNEYVTSVQRNRTALHVDITFNPEDKQKILKLNTELDLYACVMQMCSFPGFRCRHEDVNIALIVQNNAGDFAKLEYEPVKNMVETLKITERGQVERYVRFAYNYAKTHERCKITFGHKALRLPRTDGLFLEVAECLHSQYPEVEIEFMSIDLLALELITNPKQFDVICTNDRYGTALASVCAAICGGASLFCACEMGDHHAVFKPLQTKLSITDIKVLSPYGIVRACIDLLYHIGNHKYAHLLWDQLMITMLEKQIKTTEFGGNNAGEFIICDIVNRLQRPEDKK